MPNFLSRPCSLPFNYIEEELKIIFDFQLAQDKLEFFPLDRAMSLLGQDEDEKDTRLDDLMATLKEIKEKQDRDVSFVFKSLLNRILSLIHFFQV